MVGCFKALSDLKASLRQSRVWNSGRTLPGSLWDPTSDEVMVESFYVGYSSRYGMLVRFFLIKRAV